MRKVEAANAGAPGRSPVEERLGSVMARVLVVAASPVVRAGLEALLAPAVGFEVIASTSGLGTLDDDLQRHAPDVVLVETEASTALRWPAHMPPTVLLADDPTGAWTVEQLRQGVRGVLTRHASASEIIGALTAAQAGLVVVTPETVPQLLPAEETPRPEPSAVVGERLTSREVEVLRMLAEGLGNKTIAWRLGISEHTVKFHIASIFSKLGAGSRTEAVILGVRQGLIVL